MRLSLSRRALAAGLVGTVAATSVVVWWTRDSSGSATTTQTATATTETITSTVSASGTLAYADSADLSFDGSGRVTAVDVTVGATVVAGQALATIDPTSSAAALTAAEARLTAAQSTAASDGSSSSAQQASNTAAVASAQADVDDAQAALDGATLVSPIDGVVASVDVAVGDSIGSGGSSSGSAPGGSTGGATTTTSAVTVVSAGTFVVDADVAADDATTIEAGMQAEITLSGASEPVYGTVADVGLVAEVGTSGAATFPVTIDVTGTPDGLYAGTSADVSITVASVEGVLTVPTLALTTTGDAVTVEKVTDGGTETTVVEVGETYGASTEIVSGLAEGDTVQLTTPTRGGQGGQGGMGGEMPDGMMPPGEMPTGGMPGGQMPGGMGRAPQ